MEDSLRDAFERFSAFGSRGATGPERMDSRACLKLAKDCGVLGKALTPTEVDLIFAKTKTKGKNKITFEQFVECTRLWAVKAKTSHAELVLKVAASKGPTVNSALANRTTPQIQAPAAAPKSPPPLAKADSKLDVMPRLHPDWYEVKDHATGKFYYVNRKTKETSWDQDSSPSLADAAATKGAATGQVEEQKQAPPKSVFDKLTDPSLFTGAHKHRFDANTGQGLGLAGGDRAPK
ncbi:Tubulin polymerization-promoting protein family member 2, partial [Durusdinium trenchii]